MHPVLVRILKNGLPVAGVLALFGYNLAEGAGMWVASQGMPDDPAGTQVTSNGSDVASVLRYRIPLSMAGWGFGIVAVYELLLAFWRPEKLPPEPQTKSTEVQQMDEVEMLLNQILAQAEAAEAKKAAETVAEKTNSTPVDVTTPAPVRCTETESTPVLS